MSDAREQQVRDIYARWNRGDRTIGPDEMTADAVVYSALTGDSFRGPDGVRRWMAEIDEQFEDWLLNIEEIRSLAGDRLLVLGGVHFRGRASGVEFDQEMGWLIDFDGDRIAVLHNISGHDAAIEAAGLPANS